MANLLCLLLVSIFSLDYLAKKLGVISKFAALLPEVISVLILILVLGQALVTRRWSQPVKYVIFAFVLILICLIGAVAETVAPGPLVAGLRDYFRFVPLLFLPAAFVFSNRDLYKILGTFLFLAAVQVPIAFYQRFVQFAASMHTGDPVTGTVTTSSSLTIVLCLAIACVLTLYIYKRISFSVAALAFGWLAAPTLINETKATLIILPLATIGPFLLAKGVDGKWRRFLPIMGLCIAGLFAFVVVYNTLIENRWWGGASQLDEFFTEGHVEHYLYRGGSTDTPPEHVGRFDSIAFPVIILSDDWMQLMFGLGPGNVSPAFLPGMEGEYFEKYKGFGFGKTSIGNLLWELGIAGLSAFLWLFVVMWRDARYLARVDSDRQWLGAWWSACLLILFFGLLYKDILRFSETAAMLLFFSGVMASSAALVRSSRRSEKVPEDGKEDQRPRLKLAGVPSRREAARGGGR